ncbi:MAG: hypothetical protein K0R76_859 [Alphaproteobacteria bacterium]|jgi:hypothetical protein|nr:hypothetical protein [Alphaproteobacteria bacterium]MDF3033905.1 hypothetical protein [Alphaproteobacteria bacterium]
MFLKEQVKDDFEYFLVVILVRRFINSDPHSCHPGS